MLTEQTYVSAQLDRIESRMRRVETRLTKYIEAQGVDTGARKPHMEHGDMIAPGYFCTLADLFDNVPREVQTRGEAVEVMVGDRRVAIIYPEDKS